MRVFGGVRVGGVVTQWLPGRRGAPSLWHMVHDDGDEEDLDEAEAREALSLALQGTPATAAAPAGRKPAPKWSWSTEHAWVGKRVVRVFDGEPTGGVIAKWLRADREEEALWHMVHDDGDEEDLEVQEVREALRRAATDTGGHHMAGKRVATAAAVRQPRATIGSPRSVASVVAPRVATAALKLKYSQCHKSVGALVGAFTGKQLADLCGCASAPSLSFSRGAQT